MKILDQNNPINQHSLNYYLSLPYAMTLYLDIEGAYVAEIKDYLDV